jgi:hypothetical protein
MTGIIHKVIILNRDYIIGMDIRKGKKELGMKI